MQTVLPPVLRLIVILFAAFLARRNLKANRGDLRGALRLAVVFLALGTAIDLLDASSSVSAVAAIWANNLSLRLFSAALIWLGYLAVEPYVRRLWPHALIAWTRVLEGRLRDPLVGRDLLVGGVAGILSTAVFLLPWTAPWLGLPPPAPIAQGVGALGSTAQWLAVLLSMALESFLVPVVYLVCLLLFRVVLRKPWLATATFFLVVAVLQFVFYQGIPLAGLWIAATLCLGAIGLIVITRFGLFAFLVTVFFSSWERLVLTTDPGSWYFGPSALTMALFAAIAVHGFWLSIGGQLTFRDPVLDEA